MPRIKLVAVDIDGTLADSSRAVSVANRNAIQDLKSQGIIVVLASGRIGWSVETFQRAVGLEGYPFIGTNGCEVVSWNQTRIQESWLGQDHKKIAVTISQKEDIHMNGYAPADLYFTKNGKFAEIYKSRVSGANPVIVEPQTFLNVDLLKVLFIADPSHIDSVLDQYQGEFESGKVELTRSEPEYLEFLPSGASKGTGLQYLCQVLGINQAEVAAIGDYYNDLEMLEWAGFSGAMGNAPTDLKSKVDVVVQDNTSSGVAEFLAMVSAPEPV